MTAAASSPTDAMTAGHRADTQRRRERVLKVLNAATSSGQEISVSTIARQTGIDRTFLYRHRDLLERVHAAEAQPANAIGIGIGPVVSRASLQADLLAAHERAARLAAHSNTWNGDCRNRSASRPGASPVSAHPPTSTSSTSASSPSNSTSSKSGCDSRNAPKISTPPAPPTANS